MAHRGQPPRRGRGRRARRPPYGAANPSFTATTSGFVNGDAAATAYTGSPALSTSATTTSDIGGCPITTAAGTLASTNYTFTFVPGALAITKATTSMSPRAVLVTLSPGGPLVRFGTLTTTLTYGTPAEGRGRRDDRVQCA
ncbi:MBG domain-containing protein [Nocardioides terrisoli]|uniref:MBG domain-containing protein n=1 Tax=Nocardioides terrisoli TaxID=3388267 RepID=UPI0037CC10A3